MNVHNIMEEYVEKHINELYGQLVSDKAPWLSCDCDSCRNDAISYVLNRIAPHYIVSGRGAVYTAQILEDTQLKADVNALSIEAIRVISSVQRPFHKISAALNSEAMEKKQDTPHFNFPIISGSVYDGNTFEPIPDAVISLLDNKGNVLMHDFSWPNPTKTFNSTKGSFSFWPASIPCSKAEESKKFYFTLEVKANGFTSVREAFEIVVMSEENIQNNMSKSLTMKIKDIILFKD